MALDAQKPWPADKVERWPVTRLVPYAKNSRTHSPAQVSQIAGSIREWGFTVPVLVDEGGTIIAGHARTQAAQQLGLTDIPVMVASGWSDAQKRAYVIADNKLTLNAGWDESLLAMELGDLDGFDLSLTGFDDAELARLLHGVGPGAGVDPDDTPEPPVSPVSVLGDVWLLGKHRLVCGDSTDASVVAKALNGVQPHLIVTDPPYGMDYRGLDGPTQNGMRRTQRRAVTPVIGDQEAYDPMPVVALVKCKEVFLWGGDHFYQALPPGGSWIVWDKRASEAADATPGSPFEMCWSMQPHRRSFIRYPWGGWLNKERGESDRWHPTQKPIECMKRPIENNSSPGQAVYEPFSGSGTTIIASEMTDRSCHAIELSPQYVDVAVKRWQNFTGQTAMLEATGQTFDKIAVERPIAA